MTVGGMWLCEFAVHIAMGTQTSMQGPFYFPRKPEKMQVWNINAAWKSDFIKFHQFNQYVYYNVTM